MAPTIAGTKAIVIQVGSVFDPTWTWMTDYAQNGGVPIDLTGYTARSMIRSTIDSPDALADMTTENGGITLGGTEGTVTFFLAASATAEYSAPATGVWDVYLIPPAGADYAFRWLQGPVQFTPEVTR